MSKYESGDIVTYYFIIMNDNGNKRIHAWTDDKELAKIYYEFHNCKNFTIKKVTKTINEMRKILEENANDEIMIANIITRNRDRTSKNDPETQLISIPATRTEMTFINEESATFMMSQIPYSEMEAIIPHLKDKYQKALNDIFLIPIIRKVLYNKDSIVTKSIVTDDLLILFRSFPDMFGK